MKISFAASVMGFMTTSVLFPQGAHAQIMSVGDDGVVSEAITVESSGGLFDINAPECTGIKVSAHVLTSSCDCGVFRTG